MQTNRSMSPWIEGALMIALGYLLSFMKFNFSPYFGVSLGSIPLILFSIRRGWRQGITMGLAYGIFKIILGQAIFLNFVQGMIEYTIPYASLGLAGLFTPQIRSSIEKQSYNRVAILVSLASFVALFVRYFWHFLAGVIYWASYAPEGMNAWIYSLLVNGGNMLGNLVVTIIILLLLTHQSQRILLPRQY